MISITMPAIFFGHGSPMTAIEHNRYTKAWAECVQKIPKPLAILIVSAHWQTKGTKVTINKKQKTIYDFFGFPDELYNVKYEPAGSQALAQRVKELINVQYDDSWGLDHGSWSVLNHIYPKANIPVIQLSIDITKTAREHYEIAKKLISLKKEGILIIGSGNVVHNLRMLKRDAEAPPYYWAEEFNDAVRMAIINNDHEKIINYKQLPGATESCPTSEHFIPLIYLLALQENSQSSQIFIDGYQMGSTTMLSVIVK